LDGIQDALVFAATVKNALNVRWLAVSGGWLAKKIRQLAKYILPPADKSYEVLKDVLAKENGLWPR